MRILVEQPYEYEGSVAGPLENIGKLREFISKYPSSRLVDFAKLEILALRCGIVLDLVQSVWLSLQDLKEYGTLGGSEAKVGVKWTTEANQLYSSLERREHERLKETLELCSLVNKLQESVSAPITIAGER